MLCAVPPLSFPPPLPHRLALDNRLFPLDACFYHEPLGIVFLAIQKSGCSALKRWLTTLADPGVLDRPGFRLHPFCLERFALAALSAAESARILAATPVLAFVRDPLERLRSAFVNKFVFPSPENLFTPALELLEMHAHLHSLRAADPQRGLTFREFIALICTLPEDHLDPHWRPQAPFIRKLPVPPGPPNARGRLTILPLERMNETLDALSDAHGRPECRAAVSNATDKQTAGSGCLADIPSGDLYRADTHPPLVQLADEAILAQVQIALAADYALMACAGAHSQSGIELNSGGIHR